MIVYLSGKITGDEKYKEKFKAAEQRLTDAGYTVINPALLPSDMPIEKYMPICLAMLEQADAVYMLEDWKTSKGAILERKYAIYQDIEVWYQSWEADYDKL